MNLESLLDERLSDFNENVNRLNYHKDFLIKEIEGLEKDVEDLIYKADLNQKCSEIVKSWLDDLLKSSVDSMSDLTTSGLQYIIDDQDLKFSIKQELKYNRLAMRFAIENDGVEGDPVTSFGGGAVLISSLILRLAVMSRMNMGNLLLLDESMFAVANQYIPAAADFMRKLAEELGINILMVTHNDEFMNNAHVAYECSLVSDSSDSQNNKMLKINRRTV